MTQNNEPETKLNQFELLELTTQVVAACVRKNAISPTELPSLIERVQLQFAELANDSPEPSKGEPAVPINKSITNDFIVCLEDGKKLKMLKRYLRVRYNLSPEEYRIRWGLPPDYPMVAPEYAKRRSSFAKEIGLGRSAN